MECDKIEQIKKSILSYPDRLGFKTLNIDPIFVGEQTAYLIAQKEDNSYTLFIAYKASLKNNNWFFFCPSSPQIKDLELLPNYYNMIEIINKRNREAAKNGT